MEAQRRRVDVQCLAVAKSAAGEISRVAAHGMTQMRQVDTDLIRAARQGSRFQQRRTIGHSVANLKFGPRG